MTLLNIRDRFKKAYVKDEMLRGAFKPHQYISTKDYTAKDWYQVLRQRQFLLKLIESNIEIDFKAAATNFQLELLPFHKVGTEQNLSYKLLNLSCCIESSSIPVLQTKYYELGSHAPNKSLFHFDIHNQNHLDSYSSRVHDLICIDRHVDEEQLKQEFADYIAATSLRHRSIREVDNRRIRGNFSLDWSYENFSRARFRKILKYLNTDNFVRYNVLQFIDLTLYFLLLRLKIANEKLDGLFYDGIAIKISGDKYVEKYTRHLANVCLSDSFLNEFAISIQNSSQ